MAEAQAAAQNAGIASDKVEAFKVTHEVRSLTAEGAGRNEDNAIEVAKARVPSDAFDVSAAKIIRTGENGVIEFEAQTEMVARQQWKTNTPNEATLDKLECIVTPQNGFLGIGKKPGIWKAYWSVPFQAQISYLLPAEVTLSYKE